MARTHRFPWEYTLAAVLFSAGLLILTQAMGQRVEIAQAAAHTYNSSWTAKRVLTVNVTSAANASTYITDVPIGISQWEVKGSLDNSGFKETWNTPGGQDIYVEYGLKGTNQTLRRDNFESNKWIHSVDAPGIGYYTVKTADVSVLNTVVSEDNGASGYGNGLRCGRPSTSVPSSCVRAAGQYGFEMYNKNSAFINRQVINSFIPMSWTVTGYYCDDKTEAQCQ